MIPWKKIFSNWRVVLLMIFLVFALVSIFSLNTEVWLGNEGAAIRSINQNTSASIAGMQSPTSKTTPLAKEKIISFNGEPVNSALDFYALESGLVSNSTVKIITSKGDYFLTTGDTKGQIDLGIKVYDAPTTNLKKGLDLEGGTRVLLKPAEAVSQEDLETTVETLKQRLNVYGLSDVTVRTASDLTGDDFILVEIAGVTEDIAQAAFKMAADKLPVKTRFIKG